MTDCIDYLDFHYCTKNDVFMVGDNSTNPRNGLVDPSFCPEIVVIPLSVHGHKVTEIGQYSFYSCPQIKVLIIEARITVINYYAFCRSLNLERVYLPNTLTTIYGWGLQMHNVSYGNNVPSNGSVDIIIEPNSQLSHLGDHSISYKANVNIYICNHIQLSKSGNPFHSVINLTIYSPISFNILDIQTNTNKYSTLCFIYDYPTCQFCYFSNNPVFFVIYSLFLHIFMNK